MLGKIYWLGGTDLHNGAGAFAWVANGRPMNGSRAWFWGDGEPNGAGGVEHCVDMYGGDGRFRLNDRNCEQHTHFVCQFEVERAVLPRRWEYKFDGHYLECCFSLYGQNICRQNKEGVNESKRVNDTILDLPSNISWLSLLALLHFDICWTKLVLLANCIHLSRSICHSLWQFGPEFSSGIIEATICDLLLSFNHVIQSIYQSCLFYYFWSISCLNSTLWTVLRVSILHTIIQHAKQKALK